MGQPVVHFEVIARDAAKAREYYSALFGWEIDANNPMNYGTIERDGNTNAEGVGIGGGIGESPEGYAGHVTFYVQDPGRGGDSRCSRRRAWAASGSRARRGSRRRHHDRSVRGSGGPSHRAHQVQLATSAPGIVG